MTNIVADVWPDKFVISSPCKPQPEIRLHRLRAESNRLVGHAIATAAWHLKVGGIESTWLVGRRPRETGAAGILAHCPVGKLGQMFGPRHYITDIDLIEDDAHGGDWCWQITLEAVKLPR